MLEESEGRRRNNGVQVFDACNIKWQDNWSSTIAVDDKCGAAREGRRRPAAAASSARGTPPPRVRRRELGVQVQGNHRVRHNRDANEKTATFTDVTFNGGGDVPIGAAGPCWSVRVCNLRTRLSECAHREGDEDGTAFKCDMTRQLVEGTPDAGRVQLAKSSRSCDCVSEERPALCAGQLSDAACAGWCALETLAEKKSDSGRSNERHPDRTRSRQRSRAGLLSTRRSGERGMKVAELKRKFRNTKLAVAGSSSG